MKFQVWEILNKLKETHSTKEEIWQWFYVNKIHPWQILVNDKKLDKGIGMKKDEGGNRTRLGCVITSKDKKTLIKFHPLIPVTTEFEDWLIKKENIPLSKIYAPPYNFKRTGCKGCPYSLDIQEQLTIMSLYLPEEREQCEFIFKPVYQEYRRLGYRLNKNEQLKML